MDDKIKQLIEKIEDQMEGERYRHTIGVMYMAASMAMCYGEDVNRTMLAGLLHDCAKGFSAEKKIKLCEKHRLSISDSERRNPGLLHAKLGAFLAREKYGVSDEGILHAITYHTTGCEEMNLLDKIIYIADYIEPGRVLAPNLDEIRHLAFKDIDECLYRILQDSLVYLKAKDEVIDPMTEASFLYYQKLLGKQ